MVLIINVLTYLIGLSWLGFGLVGIIDPEIFTESSWAALHVQITGQFGMSDIRSFGGLLRHLDLELFMQLIILLVRRVGSQLFLC